MPTIRDNSQCAQFTARRLEPGPGRMFKLTQGPKAKVLAYDTLEGFQSESRNHVISKISRR